MRSDGEFPQLQRANRNSLQACYLVANAGQDPANLAIATFGQDHLENRPRPLLLLDRDPLDLGFAFRQINAAFQLLQLFQCRTADALHEVAFFDAELGMGQAERQVAVVRDDNQPFAALV